MKALPVGHSENRTPAKHRLLDKMLGKEIGAASYVASKNEWSLAGYALYDLTAGDGEIRYETTSPFIFAKHALYRGWKRFPVHLTFSEQVPENYQKLLDNLCSQLPTLKVRGVTYAQVGTGAFVSTDGLTTIDVRNIDARGLRFDDVPKDFWLFAFNDPNTVHRWALNAESLLPLIRTGSRVRTMTTMGCNAGGLKRISSNERLTWFQHVDSVNNVSKSLGTIDNLLVSLENDPGQWAYLVTTPKKWVDDEIESIDKLFRQLGQPVTIYSMIKDYDGYRRQQDRLFLTSRERAE